MGKSRMNIGSRNRRKRYGKRIYSALSRSLFIWNKYDDSVRSSHI